MAKSMEDYASQFEKNPKGSAVKWILGLIIFFFLIGILVTVLNILSQPAKIAEKTFDADNVLYNYEWFKQQYNDYQALNKKITDADSSVVRFTRVAGPRKDWTFEDKTEQARLQSIADGLRYQLADLVSQYNARSKMANRSIFKTNDLPEQLQ